MKRLIPVAICLSVMVVIATGAAAQAQTESVATATVTNACHTVPARPCWPVLQTPSFDDLCRQLQRNGEQMNRLMERQLGATPDGARCWQRSSAQECSETDKDLTYKIALPGCSKEDVTLTLQSYGLSLRVEAKDAEAQAAPGFECSQQSSRSVSRSLGLPCNADRDKITAALDDGVLTIKVPKTAAKVEPRVIKIR